MNIDKKICKPIHGTVKITRNLSTVKNNDIKKSPFILRPSHINIGMPQRTTDCDWFSKVKLFASHI